MTAPEGPVAGGPRPVEEMTLKEIAEEVNGTLKRMEAEDTAAWRNNSIERTRFYGANAYVVGAYMQVVRISYQGHLSYTLGEARVLLHHLRQGKLLSKLSSEIKAVTDRETAVKKERAAKKLAAKLDAKRAALPEDAVYAVHIPAQVVYYVGRVGEGAEPLGWRERHLVLSKVALGPAVRATPDNTPPEDLDRVPEARDGHPYKNPDLRGKPLKSWPVPK